MTDTWRIVIGLLAAGLVIEAVFLVATMRHVGSLMLRAGPMERAPSHFGPPAGEIVELPGYESGNRPALVVFMSSGCSQCTAILPRLRRIYADYGPSAEAGQQLDVVAIVSDQNGPGRAEYAREIGSFARTALLESLDGSLHEAHAEVRGLRRQRCCVEFELCGFQCH